MNDLRCNRCGKRLQVENGIIKEDWLSIRKEWGYFSKKDGTYMEFSLCESCVEKITGEFLIPVKNIDMTELL